MKHLDPNESGSPYWICDFCATERRGVYFKSCSTSSVRKCGFCGGEFQVEKEIYPALDYFWPSQVKDLPDGGSSIAKQVASSVADWKTKIWSFYDISEPDAISKFRAENKEWASFFDAEFSRIQRLWEFK